MFYSKQDIFRYIGIKLNKQYILGIFTDGGDLGGFSSSTDGNSGGDNRVRAFSRRILRYNLGLRIMRKLVICTIKMSLFAIAAGSFDLVAVITLIFTFGLFGNIGGNTVCFYIYRYSNSKLALSLLNSHKIAPL